MVADHAEADHYLNAPDRDFARTDEALRLRRIGENTFLTYKGPRRDAASKTRTEVEVPCPPGEATAEAYLKLFRSLGYRPDGGGQQAAADLRVVPRRLHRPRLPGRRGQMWAASWSWKSWWTTSNTRRPARRSFDSRPSWTSGRRRRGRTWNSCSAGPWRRAGNGDFSHASPRRHHHRRGPSRRGRRPRRRQAGRVRPDHGGPPRRARQPHPGIAGRVRLHRRLDLRQPDPVRPERGLLPLPPDLRGRPRAVRGNGHGPDLRPDGRGDVPAGVADRRRGGEARRTPSAGSRGRATSAGWPRSCSSCSTSSSRTRPTSARRTPSRPSSSGGWRST